MHVRHRRYPIHRVVTAPWSGEKTIPPPIRGGGSAEPSIPRKPRYGGSSRIVLGSACTRTSYQTSEKAAITGAHPGATLFCLRAITYGGTGRSILPRITSAAKTPPNERGQ